ncbi:MAG: hypothetical protein GF392_04235 [Candidatus Omnitrophica bacterium]|nr:hypothetical protein [Candidatus Omnitrophota bacterium]
MAKKLFFLMICSCVLFSASSFAQEEQVPKTVRTIQEGDILQVMVYGTEDPLLSRGLKVRVDPQGEIKLPFMGDIRVDGLLEGEAAEIIESKLAKNYLTRPQVVLFIETYTRADEARWQAIGVYYIFGEVNNPGRYYIVPKPDVTTEKYRTWEVGGASSVVDAIFLAEGFTDIANTNGVFVRRGTDGNVRKLRVPVGRIYKTGDMSRDIKLEDGDIIIVPESWF